MNNISDDIIWRYLQGIATAEDMKALNEYISASPDNKKYLFSIEELYHLGKSYYRKLWYRLRIIKQQTDCFI